MVKKTILSSSTRIAASPEAVYALVSDLTRMGEWSPEATGGHWVGGMSGPAEGVKFKGTNAHGAKKWTTTVTVTDATPPRRFAFSNGLGPIVVAEWIYEIAPVADGCELTESWVDCRGFYLRAQRRKFSVTGLVGKLVTGVDDRFAHTQSMIEATLARIKETAEGPR